MCWVSNTSYVRSRALLPLSHNNTTCYFIPNDLLIRSQQLHVSFSYYRCAFVLFSSVLVNASSFVVHIFSINICLLFCIFTNTLDANEILWILPDRIDCSSWVFFFCSFFSKIYHTKKKHRRFFVHFRTYAIFFGDKSWGYFDITYRKKLYTTWYLEATVCILKKWKPKFVGF